MKSFLSPFSDRYSVNIRSRKPIAPNQRDVSLYYFQNGQPVHRTLTVGRPTSFEDIIVAVMDGSQPASSATVGWQGTLRGGARFTYHKLKAAASRLAPKMGSAVPMFDVRAVEPNNIAHLLLGILPLSLHAQEVLEGTVTSVFRDVRGPFRELLEVLNVNATFTSRRLKGRIVKIRGTRGLAAYDLLDVFDMPNITVLPNIYDRYTFNTPWKPEKIFIARRGERSLLNQVEVEKILIRKGYEVIFMEDHPILDQLGIASHAKHVVAVHGAGMAGLVMNSGLESVIEILPPNVYHPYYPMCIGELVKRYMLLIPEFDERVQFYDWPDILTYKSAPFSVELQALEKALDEAG